MRDIRLSERIRFGAEHSFSVRGLIVLALATMGSVAQAAELDQDLANGVDFRDLAYRVCLQAEECSVEGMTIRAETRRTDTSPWEPGLLYWDPIDGLGVLGGGQDDEIDFNERIVVRRSEPLAIKKVWLTDLFSGEITHYRGLEPALTSDIDFEAGRIAIPAGTGDQREVELRGVIDLPESPFNEAIDGAIFIEPGDLHYRLLIAESEALLSIPLLDRDGQIDQRTVRLNDIEPGKLNLFSDGEELVYDLDDVFARNEIIELFPIGQHNATAMARIVNQTDRLSRLNSDAVVRRDVGDIPNGEVGAVFEVAEKTSELVFYAPAGTSNDFSVAGLVLAE